VLFGFAPMPEIRRLSTIDAAAADRYADVELPALLALSRCHLSFFPSVWPETYCYTLSQAFFAGLYPVAFDLGALAHRIRAAGWGRVIPFALSTDPAKVVEALLNCRVPPPPADWKPVAGASLYRSIAGDYYDLPALALRT
jgi:glycosyltransferase involved in cell wall biosynthesis